MNSLKKKVKKSRKKHDKKHKKDKSKRRSSSSSSSSSSCSSSSSSSSSSSDEKHKRKKHKKHHKKSKELKFMKIESKERMKTGEGSCTAPPVPVPDEDFSIPVHLMNNKHKAPETREEYEKRQSVIRKVVDPETGRTRLIKGDGEILEEIVTRDRHHEINRLATQTDGQAYEKKTIGWAITSDKK